MDGGWDSASSGSQLDDSMESTMAQKSSIVDDVSEKSKSIVSYNPDRDEYEERLITDF